MQKNKYYTILTKIGIAKFIAARASGNGVNLKSFKLSSRVILPNEEMQSLEDVVYEANINSKSIDEQNPNYVNLMCHVPSNIGGFEVNAIGIYDEEGDLLAVGNTPRTYKPLLEQGSAKELMIKVVMELSNAQEVILKLDPSVIMASRDYVDAIKIKLELKITALEEELKALIDTKENIGVAADLDARLRDKLTALIDTKEDIGVAKALVDALRTEFAEKIDKLSFFNSFRSVVKENNVVYTNNTKKPIIIIVAGQWVRHGNHDESKTYYAYSDIYINNILIAQEYVSEKNLAFSMGIIPPNATYKINASDRTDRLNPAKHICYEIS
ncbi:phage tail protein [Campylobacter sp.]|uniref:phage tail protein n=1 Tax=Campylobacter sp. TaxID=205 RepID=UPI0025C73629|nr:phage tail protein [Campylobacter sp.]